MTSVGIILKTERERQGRDIAGIAEELCITQSYLRALEQDDLKNLPGIFFYKSFLKQYAAILGVDPMVLQPGIDVLTSAEPLPRPLPAAYVPSALDGRAPVRDRDPIVKDGNRSYLPDRRVGVPLAMLAAVLLACSGFYAWWNRSPETPARATVAPHMETTAASVAPAAPAAPPSVNVTSTTGPDGVNHVVLNLSATEKTWILITSDGKRIFSGILEPSQTKTLTGQEEAKIRVGNAGGLEVLWNGKPIGPIGPRGQVRELLFTPENYKILPPSPTL